MITKDALMSELHVGTRGMFAAAGFTEVYVHPAVDTPELRAFAPDWAARVDDHDLITGHSTLRALAERAGATLIGYRELRDLQRRVA